MLSLLEWALILGVSHSFDMSRKTIFQIKTLKFPLEIGYMHHILIYVQKKFEL